jgi:hypothetical protein
MGVPPSLVSEKIAQRRGDLPTLVPFRSGQHSASTAKHLAVQFHKIRHGVTGIGSDALRCWHDAAPLNQQGGSLNLPLLRRCSLLLRFARKRRIWTLPTEAALMREDREYERAR